MPAKNGGRSAFSASSFFSPPGKWLDRMIGAMVVTSYSYAIYLLITA